MRHFRPYLLGHHCILRTDHSSLQWIYSMKSLRGNWHDGWNKFMNWTLKWCIGREPCLIKADKSECPAKIKPPSQFSCSDGAKACTVQASKELLSKIRELKAADKNVGPILQSVISRKIPDASFCNGKSREFNHLVQQSGQLLFKNGALHRYHEDEGSSNIQVVVLKAAT